eukprot:RCo026247
MPAKKKPNKPATKAAAPKATPAPSSSSGSGPHPAPAIAPAGKSGKAGKAHRGKAAASASTTTGAASPSSDRSPSSPALPSLHACSSPMKHAALESFAVQVQCFCRAFLSGKESTAREAQAQAMREAARRARRE